MNLAPQTPLQVREWLVPLALLVIIYVWCTVVTSAVINNKTSPLAPGYLGVSLTLPFLMGMWVCWAPHAWSWRWPIALTTLLLQFVMLAPRLFPAALMVVFLFFGSLPFWHLVRGGIGYTLCFSRTTGGWQRRGFRFQIKHLFVWMVYVSMFVAGMQWTIRSNELLLENLTADEAIRMAMFGVLWLVFLSIPSSLIFGCPACALLGGPQAMLLITMAGRESLRNRLGTAVLVSMGLLVTPLIVFPFAISRPSAFVDLYALLLREFGASALCVTLFAIVLRLGGYHIERRIELVDKGTLFRPR